MNLLREEKRSFFFFMLFFDFHHEIHIDWPFFPHQQRINKLSKTVNIGSMTNTNPFPVVIQASLIPKNESLWLFYSY